MSDYDSNEVYNKNYETVKSRLAADRPDDERHITFSVSNKKNMDEYVNINDVARKGKIKFVMWKDIDWQEGQNYRCKETYISDVVESPTWLDVCVLANDMILKTCDTHHRFLEDIEIDQKASQDGDTMTMCFVMGS